MLSVGSFLNRVGMISVNCDRRLTIRYAYGGWLVGLACARARNNTRAKRRLDPEKKEAIMSDDLNKRGAQDRQRVNINEEHEVRYWTDALNVTPEQLRKAVKEVGPMADDVRNWLGKLDPAERAG